MLAEAKIKMDFSQHRSLTNRAKKCSVRMNNCYTEKIRES